MAFRSAAEQAAFLASCGVRDSAGHSVRCLGAFLVSLTQSVEQAARDHRAAVSSANRALRVAS